MAPNPKPRPPSRSSSIFPVTNSGSHRYITTSSCSWAISADFKASSFTSLFNSLAHLPDRPLPPLGHCWQRHSNKTWPPILSPGVVPLLLHLLVTNFGSNSHTTVSLYSSSWTVSNDSKTSSTSHSHNLTPLHRPLLHLGHCWWRHDNEAVASDPKPRHRHAPPPSSYHQLRWPSLHHRIFLLLVGCPRQLQGLILCLPPTLAEARPLFIQRLASSGNTS